MAEPREVRQKLKITIGALLAVDLAAVALLISPIVGSERSRREESNQLWKELQMKTRQVEPLRDMDKKILVARHGRRVAREALAEALWPGEAPGPVANRLSVALSTLRSVLDPARRFDIPWRSRPTFPVTIYTWYGS